MDYSLPVFSGVIIVCIVEAADQLEPGWRVRDEAVLE